MGSCDSKCENGQCERKKMTGFKWCIYCKCTRTGCPEKGSCSDVWSYCEDHISTDKYPPELTWDDIYQAHLKLKESFEKSIMNLRTGSMIFFKM